MKKHLVLVAVLGLLLLPVLNPSPSLMPVAIGNELNEKPFFAAGDGDESSESITSFAETLPDDTLYYPDAFNNGTALLGTNGFVVAGTESNDYTYTHSNDDSWWGVTGHPNDLICELWFSSVVTNGQLEGFTHALEIHNVKDVDAFIYNHTSSSWVNITFDDTHWVNGTTYDPDYWNTTHIGFRINCSSIINDIYIDYAEVTFYYMTLADSNHYAESFADVSDCAGSGGVSISTDGDVVRAEQAGDDTYRYLYVNGISMASAEGYYLEVRVWNNVTGGAVKFYTGSSDNGGSLTLLSGTEPYTTTPITYKFRIGHSNAVECVALRFRDSEDTSLYSDYCRVSSATEMGWQHDGSTTAGVTADNDANFDYVFSSDGDILNITTTVNTGSSNNGDTLLVYDTTANAADLEDSDYPFFAMNYKCAVDGGNYYVYTRYGGKSVTVQLTTDNAWHMLWWNVAAGTSTGSANILFRYYRSVVGQTAQLLVNWTKAFSIANASLTLTNTGTDDYLYISATGCIRGEVSGATTFIDLTWDPVLSVDTSVYNVWNTSGCSCLTGIKVDGSWSVWTAETRGGMDAGTLTSFGFRFCCCEAGCICVKDITFISDGTAPDILDKFVTPVIPDDDESVTLTAVTYDAVEVYEVTINAVVYPAGFSDVDYELTEQTTNVLWSYEFSTLSAGYYLFQVTASDGANTYSEYIPVTVRVSSIEIDTYTFFGASSDFTFMQFSGYISHDCTYNISEWSDSWAKNETHTGSVSEGMFNIAWNKIGVDDLEANFTIIFVNGSLSKTVPGYYGTAYKELRITEIEFENVEESLAVTNITVNFYTNKDIDWFVYDRDDSDAVLASGSSLEGMDVLTWVKDRSPYAHKYAIKWTDGVSNIWVNSSYWTYRENIDSLDQPGKDWDAADARRTIEFWTTLGAFVAIGGIIAIGISHYKLNKKIGNLPNYRTQ